jgi:hypothetical protein
VKAELATIGSKVNVTTGMNLAAVLVIRPYKTLILRFLEIRENELKISKET